MKITHVSLYVRDQDEAVVWFSEKLGFKKASDVPLGPESRWVTVSSPHQPSIEIVLEHESMAQDAAMAEDLRSRVGKSSILIFEVTDIHQLVAELKAKDVTVELEPTVYPWGTQSVIVDLYGNKFILSQAPEGGYPTGMEQ
ncbi:MAG: VOC family protein [Anaerolineae bacterium]